MKKSVFHCLVLPLVVALTVLFSACAEESSTVDQTRIYTIYEVFHDANEGKTYARATFRFGNALGTLLRLSTGASVTFNGDAMAYQPAGYYEKAYEGVLTGGTFVYDDLDGNTYTNSVSGIKPIAFPADSISLSKSADYELTWVGDPLGPNGPSTENVGLLVSAKLFLELDANATSVKVNSSQLASLTNGPAIAVMDRYFIRELAEKTDAGGSITGKYRALNKAVQITD
ncbi:MAG: hypothetical protein EAZ89_00055 [Bacteroidetes bacterium]|nr:MAG: hypothetical protein EAZ89_00055 [Bacteroidota bacterium]